MFCCKSHEAQAILRQFLGLRCDVIDREYLARIMGEDRKQVLESGRHPGELCLVVRFQSLSSEMRLISAKILGEDVYTADSRMNIIHEGFFVPSEEYGRVAQTLTLLTSTAGSA